jgi:thiol-disulfide isomerase/thioredoxin
MSCALNQPAPDIQLVDLETGETQSLQQLVSTSKLPTIVLFYATWSHKCKEDVELFEAWSKDDHDKLANFVLVSLDENVRETLEFLDQVNPSTGKARVCRDFRDGDAPTVLHFGCAVDDVPEPYGAQRVPHKVVIDHEGIMRRNGDDFVWDDVAGLLQYRRELKEALEVEATSTVLFPVFIKT